MATSEPVKGILVPTGKQSPKLGVDFVMSHYDAEGKIINGSPVISRKTSVHFISNDKGQPIPLGDFDLVMGNKMVRLKHIAGEWLVLSSNA